MPVPATFMASPVAYDGKLLLTSVDGDTYVVKAGPVHQVLASNSIGEPAASTPSISQGRILVRGAKHLFCIKSAWRETDQLRDATQLRRPTMD